MVYNMYYNGMLGALQSTMKNFQFELVVYDEVEEFPMNKHHENFTYPFVQMKRRLNYYKPDAQSKLHNIEDVFVQRSNVCLEPSISNQTSIMRQFMRALKSATMGNETKGFENTRPYSCGKEYDKIKF